MKIKSPLTNKNEVKLLCEAGSDELFCGIEPYGWRTKYKNFCINQRSTGANFTKLADLEKAIFIAHKYRTKVHIAMNAFFYLEEQYEKVVGIIKDVLDIGADGVIFADPTLLLKIDKSMLKSKEVIMGTDAVIFNSSAVKFYKKLGATRIVLPRSLTITEIKEIIQPDKLMEYEVFIFNDLCYFEDGLCTYCKEDTGGVKKEGKRNKEVYFFSTSRISKRGYDGGCRGRFSRQRISLRNKPQTGSAGPFTYWMKKHIEGCGACAIYDLKMMGIGNLKVLDRNLPVEEKVKATLFIKESLDLLRDNNISKVDYLEKCKALFKKTFKVKCNRYDCYYPSVFLENKGL